jgi:hypothetical protein
VLCVVSAADYDEFAQKVRDYYIIRKTDETVLLSNKLLETSGIKSW